MKWRDIIRFQWHALWNGRFPPALIILFLPLLYAFLFGTIYSHNVVNDVPVLILDEDQSKASRTLIQMYDDSEKLRIVGYASSKEELEAAMYDGQALAAIAIPRDFSKDMKTGAGTDVAYIVNSANNMNGNAVIGAIREINQSYSTAVAASTLEGAGVLPAWAMNLAYPIRMGLRILNNPTNGYTSFMLSALTINGLQISIMLAFTPGIVVFIRKRKLIGQRQLIRKRNRRLVRAYQGRVCRQRRGQSHQPRQGRDLHGALFRPGQCQLPVFHHRRGRDLPGRLLCRLRPRERGDGDRRADRP